MISFVFAACSEGVFSDSQSEELVDVTYTISTLSQTNTRATHDGDGNAANINRYICEVWRVGANNALSLIMRKENCVNVTHTQFDFRLITSNKYKVLFWADCADVSGSTATDLYYETNAADKTKGLQEVTIKDIANGSGNTDKMDAFYAMSEIKNLKGSISQNVSLKRPFAQLNVITTDVKDVEDSEMPNKVKLTFNAPTKFNVLTGM